MNLEEFKQLCKEELEKLKEESPDSLNELFEKTNTVTFAIDTTRPVEKYEKDGDKKVRFPIWHDEKQKIWFLNRRNPVYHDLLKRAVNDQTVFKVLKTGEKKNTRYTIIDDDQTTITESRVV